MVADQYFCMMSTALRNPSGFIFVTVLERPRNYLNFHGSCVDLSTRGSFIAFDFLNDGNGCLL